MVLLFFVSPLPYGKMFPFENFFHWWGGNSCLGQDLVNRKGGARGSCVFLSKTAQHSAQCGQVHSNHPSRQMGKYVERVFKKENSLKPNNAASHNNVSWYTDVSGFLEHSPRGGNLYYKGPALQKIIHVFWVTPFNYDSFLMSNVMSDTC